MAERNRGLRSILGLPWIYSRFQRSIGTDRGRRILVDEYLDLKPESRVLDVGCANGRFLDVLPPVRYVGFDPSPGYIEAARGEYGDRGSFMVGTTDSIDPAEIGRFDAVVARGVLHHLDDSEVERLAGFAAAVLDPGGRLVSLDPCYCRDQRRIARFLADRDRGQNVRTAERYADLIGRAFGSLSVHEHHDLLRVPYDHAVIVATAA